LQFLVRRVKDHCDGCFVDLSGFDADQTILDHIDPPDAVRPGGGRQPVDQIEHWHRDTVDRRRDPALERDLDIGGLAWAFRW
jgi:hypothetical protein